MTEGRGAVDVQQTRFVVSTSMIQETSDISMIPLIS